MAGRIEKQVSLIEDLLKDKATLSDKVDELLTQLAETTQKMDKQKRSIDERVSVELRQKKEQWHAAEKVKRDKWERERVAEIRSQTVKGLEAEI